MNYPLTAGITAADGESMPRLLRSQPASPTGAAVMFNFFRPYVPGFNFRPQGDAPGFNIRPSAGMLNSNFNENDEQPEEAIWPTETVPPAPDIEEPAPHAPSTFPEWFYKLVPMLRRSPSMLDPLTGQRIAINSPPSLPPTELRVPEKWPYSNVFSRANIASPALSMQSTYFPPVAQSAVPSAWPQPRLDSWPYSQLSSLRIPSSSDIIQRPIGYPGLLEPRPTDPSNFNLGHADLDDVQQRQQPTPWQAYQQRPSSSLGTGMPGSDSLREASILRQPEWLSSPLSGPDRPSVVDGRAEDSRPSRQDSAQVPQIASQSASYRRDAAGLPIGTILSSIRSLGGAIAPYDPNVHLVGDGNSLEDVPRNERHERGVEASIADHLAKGFELVARGPRAVDVPGFSSPRLYDYIIRDPATGLCYGVEVKTTIMSTIWLDRKQVLKDATVIDQGGKVRTLNNLELHGVSYSVYCFGCEELDVRSAALVSILQNAGVPVVPGILPGDIRPWPGDIPP